MDGKRSLPIGVFDSGVGGLTVLSALHEALPHENLLYLGDTARVPYGTKTTASVTRYAEQAAQALYERQIKLLVVACNTASAAAVKPLSQLYPDIPVVGVVGPGAEASCKVTRSKRIGVIATESTVRNQAYQTAILDREPEATVRALACSMFVALAEEGWHSGDLVDQIVTRCLEPLLNCDQGGVDTLVLGCTHFPVLKESIGRVMGEAVTLVDSAEMTARAVGQALKEAGIEIDQSGIGKISFLVTDGPERFANVAKHFFAKPVESGAIDLVDIQHFKKI